MTATKTVSLNDYANDRQNVVIFFAGIGQPTGDYTVVGHPDLDFADRNGLLDLAGTVDASGDWRWDGEGQPTDDRSNSITKVHAYVSADKWANIVSEYESEG